VLGEIITRFDGEHIRLGMVYQKPKKLEFGVDSSKLSEMVSETGTHLTRAARHYTINDTTRTRSHHSCNQRGLIGLQQLPIVRRR
jgi:hypothetical protein